MILGTLVKPGEKYRLHIITVGDQKKPIFRGYEMGPKLSILKETEDHFWVKCGYHKTWAGRANFSEPLLCPTQYWKLTKTPVAGQNEVWDCVVVDTSIPGKKLSLVTKFLSEEEKTLAQLIADHDN